MFTNVRLGCFLLAFLSCSAVASAQQFTPPTQADAAKIYLDVVVTGKSGPPVTDLQQQDFTLLDDGVPQTITSFKVVTGRETPIEVVLVIDAVNARAQIVDTERIQIDKFLRAHGGNLTYPTAVVVVADKGIQTVANFSTDGNALAAALQQADVARRFIGRSMGYWGAIERFQTSLNALAQLAASEEPRPGRKLILWVSPGWPLDLAINSSDEQHIFASIAGISTDLMLGRITLDSIDPLGVDESMMRASDQDADDWSLRVFAIQSGGLAFSSGNDIAWFLQQCVAGSAPYYEISFHPAPPEQPNEYHSLEIKLTRPGLTARTRQGYYAQP
jgi:VWFA-related protein